LTFGEILELVISYKKSKQALSLIFCLIPKRLAKDLEVYLLGFDSIKISAKEKETLEIRRKEREGKKNTFERKRF